MGDVLGIQIWHLALLVLDRLGKDGCEGVNSIQLVVRDDHEQWEKGFPDV